jgi:hypothetical protein
MTPAPGKKRGRKPSKTPTKVRATITIDPDIKMLAEAHTSNFSALVEDLLKKELRRQGLLVSRKKREIFGT